jgi:hypothetical protein
MIEERNGRMRIQCRDQKEKREERRKKDAIHENHIQEIMAVQRRIKVTKGSSKREMMQIELCISRKDGNQIEARMTNANGDARQGVHM